LAEGALSRFLAEAAWFPWRLRPGRGLVWSAVDDRHARATLSDGGVSVSVEFGFDAADDLVEVDALRSRKVDTGYVDTPWNGRFDHHRVVEGTGVRIPFRGEVAWIVDGVRLPYWRGSIVDARFEETRP
jgi:hypothetical protein